MEPFGARDRRPRPMRGRTRGGFAPEQRGHRVADHAGDGRSEEDTSEPQSPRSPLFPYTTLFRSPSALGTDGPGRSGVVPAARSRRNSAATAWPITPET